MSETSVEEIVGIFENDVKGGHYEGHNRYEFLTVDDLRTLIADWRKRGERIAELELEVSEWYNRAMDEGHGY